MPTRPDYFYAMRPKQGEFTALQHVPSTDRGAIIPILDLEWDDSIVGRTDLDKLVGQVFSAWGGSPLIVDASSADGFDGGREIFGGFLRLLRDEGAPAIPTVGLAATQEFVELAAETHSQDGLGICLRLQVEDFGPSAAVGAAIEELLRSLGVEPEAVDLVVDVGAVDESNLGLNSALLGLALPSLPYAERWRHVAILSGGFPASLEIVKKTVVPIVRADAGLWRQVNSEGAIPRILDFGDYGVTHPRMALGVGYRSAPNLRYTHADDWKAMKWTLGAQEGHSGFYEIARIFRDGGILDPDNFSWGDHEIHSRAARVGGPGGGTQWKAWSTSHHLAKVNSRLSTLGEP